jgi:hypothetical protein
LYARYHFTIAKESCELLRKSFKRVHSEVAGPQLQSPFMYLANATAHMSPTFSECYEVIASFARAATAPLCSKADDISVSRRIYFPQYELTGESMTPRGLMGAVLYAKNLDRLVEFYSAVAGIEPRSIEKGFAILGSMPSQLGCIPYRITKSPPRAGTLSAV